VSKPSSTFSVFILFSILSHITIKLYLNLNLIYLYIYNMNLNYDIYTFLLKFIDSPNDLSSYCRQNKYFYNLCKENKNIISKHFLDKYQVNYQNPDDFIYKFNKVDQKDYKNKMGEFNYPSLFKSSQASLRSGSQSLRLAHIIIINNY